MKYLFWCANEHLEFRIPEFESISKIFEISLNWVHKSQSDPWIILDLKEESLAKSIISRSISTKYCIELWGEGNSRKELFEKVKNFPKENIERFCSENRTFKLYCEAFMKKLSYDDRMEIVHQYSFLPFKGKVRMKNPDDIYSHLEFWGLDHNNPPLSPIKLYFGRCIGSGQRELISKFSIKSRLFIGNTTMDPTLSFLMANLATVSSGDLVLDPFVGTGSLLLAAAQFGGLVFGGDIDFLMMHARTRPSRVGQKLRKVDENMKGNFKQYKLENFYGDIIVADNSVPPWRAKKIFKAIIADPPYGIREPTEKIGTTKKEVKIPEHHLPQHYPSKIEYDLSEIVFDLLNLASERLEVEGRCVFWYPVNREEYDELKLPKHQSLKLVANCEQVLSSHTSRRLLVYEKSECVETALHHQKAEEIGTSFRENFFNANPLSRKERKARIKKYGNLNYTNHQITRDDSG